VPQVAELLYLFMEGKKMIRNLSVWISENLSHGTKQTSK